MVAKLFGTDTVMLVVLQLDGVAAVPLNVTVLVPCVPPKFVPVIVTEPPTGPELGFKLEMFGVSVKSAPLLAIPPTVTTILPVDAPAGTAAKMTSRNQPVGVAVTPLNVTVLEPCGTPKPPPKIPTLVPIRPDVGFRLEMLGVTVNVTPLLTAPPTLTNTGPVTASAPEFATAGTVTTMLVALQLVTTPTPPPVNPTPLDPCAAPKLEPVIVTEVPTGPEVGFRLIMFGGGVTVKTTWLLPTPATTTSTRSFPIGAPVGTGTKTVVAVQLVGVDATPLNLIVLVPCVAPKFVPLIVTVVPTGADVGFRLVMLGGDVTVNIKPLLAIPPTVTTTFPFVAPAGTGATMLVSLQLVGIAVVPLKVTVLVP